VNRLREKPTTRKFEEKKGKEFISLGPRKFSDTTCYDP
jgi:hypothetical protein